MKFFRLFALLAVLNSCAWIMPQEVSAQEASASFQLFYDDLNPFGMWVDYPPYGYVWIPNEDHSFVPYGTSGQWVFTDDGWTWDSDYDWGWATFHYGRWDYDDVYGWFWVPDDVWGPAWVSWRSSPGYYGWTPLRPGISITLAFGSEYRERNERWMFVRDMDFTNPDIGRHYVDRGENERIIRDSRVIVTTRTDPTRNVTYIAGPDRNEVERTSRTSVRSIPIRESNEPGHHLSNGELQIYRPRVQRGSSDGRIPVPPTIVKLKDVRPASERKAGNQQRVTAPARNIQQGQQPGFRGIDPSNNSGQTRQQQNVTPPKGVKQNDGLPATDRNAGNRRQVTNPAKNARKDQRPESRSASPSNNGQKVNQQQKVAPSRKIGEVQPAQSKTTKSGQDKSKRKDNKDGTQKQ